LALTHLLSSRNLSLRLMVDPLSYRSSLTHPLSLMIRLIMDRLSKNGEAHSAKYKLSDMLHRQVDTQRQLEYTSFEQKELVIQRIKDTYTHV